MNKERMETLIIEKMAKLSNVTVNQINYDISIFPNVRKQFNVIVNNALVDYNLRREA